MSVRLGLEGRSALVLGTSSEIAIACAERLREEGMTVAVAPTDDQADRAACEAAVERALELGGGRLDVLVTTVGPPVDGSIGATSEAVFRELLERDLTAAFRTARACLRPMRAQGAGSIIHVASDTGIRAAHEHAASSVASAAVIALAELLGAESAPDGVRVNAACPDQGAGGADVAALVAWLACDESAHVNGTAIRIDGATGAVMALDTRT